VPPEKKTAEAGSNHCEAAAGPRQAVPFLSAGGTAQERYERVRSYALTPVERRAGTSPARFDLRRFQRFGLLGLVDGKLHRRSDDFEIELVPVGAVDAKDRVARLCTLLAGLLKDRPGGDDASSRVVRQGLDQPAGEGADDPEPARRRYGIR
jgi:hypothetical protein